MLPPCARTSSSALRTSGSSDNTIHEFAWKSGTLTARRVITLGPAERHPGGDIIENAGFVAGLAISPDGRWLYATQIYGQMVRAIDLEDGTVHATADLPAEPYTCVLSADST